jgi:hypothetical protein
MKLRVLAVVLGAALLSHVIPASAATIGATYTGFVNSVGGSVGPGPFAVGDTFTLNVLLDNTVPPIESHPDSAFYDAVLQFSGTFNNGYAFTAKTGGIPGMNGIWVRQWAIEHSVTIGANDISAPPVSGIARPSTYIHFEDPTATMLNSLAIPTDLASLLSLSDGYFQLLFTGSGFDELVINGTITSAVAITQTPIPAALPLFAAALGGLGFMGWKRRRIA